MRLHIRRGQQEKRGRFIYLLACKVEFGDAEKQLLEKYQGFDAIDCRLSQSTAKITGPSSVGIYDLAREEQIWAVENALPESLAEIPSVISANLANLFGQLRAREAWGQGASAKEVIKIDL
jgi:hypothetical protein